ncbi:MAG: PEGA domain-containing protein, partial [Pseudomonadota bacterium]
LPHAFGAPGPARDEATLPHAFGAPEAARGVAHLSHGLELPPGDGPGFGAAQPAPFGAPPPAEPPPAPSTSVPRGLGPAPAPVLRQDPEAKRREAVKIAVFWSITIGALVVSVVSFGGYRAIEAQRLAAARGLGSDVSPELFLGGYADRAQRDEAPDEAEAAPARSVTGAPAAVSERAPLAATPAAAPTGAGAFPVAEQGHMSLSSNPIGARICLDNVEIGHTPLEGFAVAPGHHVVRIELDGYHWASRSIEAAPGAAVDLGSIQMERVVADTGPVRLWSGGHSGASVFVDGRHVGHLPVETVLTRGTHTFFVQPTESEPFEVVLEVVPGVDERPADLQLAAP